MLTPYKASTLQTNTGLFSSTDIPSSSRLRNQTSILKAKSSRKSIQKTSNASYKEKFVAKLSFGIKKQPYQNRRIKTEQSPNRFNQKILTILKKTANPQKCSNLLKQILIRKSTQQHQAIQAYSVGTVKGINNIINTHQISIFLGSIKHIMLIEGYQGTFASNYIKKQLSLQLLKRLHQNQQKFYSQDIGITLTSIYNIMQNKLKQQQKQSRDRSGCSSMSIVITKDTIYVGNCGISQVYCYTKMKSFMAMSKCHDTKNPQQLDRIVKLGAKLYRTTVNLVFKKQLDIDGPIRIHPTGSTITRGFGFPTNYEEHKQIISTPETFYIHRQDVQWIILMSSSLVQLFLLQQIQQIVLSQIKRQSISYTLHDVSEAIARKFITTSVNLGLKHSATVVFLFLGVKQYIGAESSFMKQDNFKQSENLTKNTYSNKPIRSFKYAGNRRSFFKQGNQKNFQSSKQ